MDDNHGRSPKKVPQFQGPAILTEDEVEFLTGLAAAYSAHGPLSDDELGRVVEWASGIRLGADTLELVLKGFVVLTWDRDAEDIRLWSRDCVNRA